MNEQLLEKFRRAGQAHIPRLMAGWSEPERARFSDQIALLDLDWISRLIGQQESDSDWAELARRSVPPPAFRLRDSDAVYTAEQARSRGQEALRAGQVAVILVAGGQGSRLGFEHPKGMFPIGPVSRHSIFQILIERVLATARRYETRVPLFVMTSPATHDETVAYLESANRFGLPAADLTVFCQGTMPAVDASTGELLLSGRGSLALAPDGHGGMLAALERSGCLQQAVDRGIQHFSYGQIDNPLVQICHPELIGYHLLAESEMTSQVVQKEDPLEKVGNVVVVDGKMRIIEYSDLPEDMARRRNPDGSLFIWAGSIAVHVFAASFLERIAHQADALPFHRARKKVPYLDEQGVVRKPERPNAIKFERFIFDLLPWAQNAIVVEGAKSGVFAPLKNAEGSDTDTPTLTREAMIRLHADWLRRAGVKLANDVVVEISPLWALDAVEVAQRVRLPLNIGSPTFLAGDAT